MIDESLYPAPIPFSRELAIELVAQLDKLDATQGAFLTFVMIPVKERIGEWRFAGASRSLGQAFRRIGEHARAMGTTKDEADVARDLTRSR